MKLRYIIQISFRNLVSGKTRSILTILAISIGFSTILFLLAAGYGIQKVTTSEISAPDTLSIFEASTLDSDITSIDDATISKIKRLDNVEAVEPAVILPGKLLNTSLSTDISVKGFTEKYFELNEDKLLSGKKLQNTNTNDILISSGALARINPTGVANANLRLTARVATDTNLSPIYVDGEIKEIESLHIFGVVDDENPYIILPMKKLQDELSLESYNIIKVKVKNQALTQTTRKSVENLGLPTEYVGDTINQINNFFSIFRYIIGGFGLIATIVAVIGMFNTLIVSLIERTSEIGILKSHGARRRDIWLLFISESLMLSVFGGVAGLVLGVISSEAVNVIYNLYATSNGGKAISLFVFPPSLFLYLLLASVAIGFATGLYPAIRASKIKILDAIKYE